MVDSDLALLDPLTDVEEPQGHVFCASTVEPVPGDERRGRVSVVDEQLDGLNLSLNLPPSSFSSRTRFPSALAPLPPAPPPSSTRLSASEFPP